MLIRTKIDVSLIAGPFFNPLQVRGYLVDEKVGMGHLFRKEFGDSRSKFAMQIVGLH